MKDQVARRRMLREAAAGIDALNTWIQDVFERADEAEAAGDELLAIEMRGTVTEFWSLMNGAPAGAIACELHEAMSPTHAPFLDPVPH